MSDRIPPMRDFHTPAPRTSRQTGRDKPTGAPRSGRAVKLIRIPLAAAAVVSLGVLAAAPASAEGGDFTKPRSTVAKGQSGPTSRALATLAPANDNLTGAQFLPSANNSISSRNTGATVESGEPSHGDQLHPASNSVWFRWRAPATGRAIFRTIGSNFDTTMAAYRTSVGNPTLMSQLTQIAANDDLVLDNSTTASQIKFSATAGTDYFIAVDGFGTATGDIKLTWTTNDDFAAAQVLPGPPAGGFSTFAVHNDGTGPQSGEPRHAGAVSTTSVWYAWTAPSSGVAEFETTQNNYDTVLAVYTGNQLNALTEVASNDDLQPGVHRSRVRFFATAGTTYRIALAGFNGQTGFEVVRYTLTKPEIVAGTASATEGSAGTKILNLPVRLTTPSPGTVTVRFATEDGTAKAGSDYNATSGTLSFAPGATTTFVPVTLRGDQVLEVSESFSLKLSDPTGGFTIKTATGTGTITNDD